MNSLPGGFDIDYRLLLAAKTIPPVAALSVLVWDLVSRGSGTKVRDTILMVLGVLAFLAWWNFGALHGRGRPIHVHDVFHYYLGSKYYAELGYTRIYQCTAVAEVQRGRGFEVARRSSRSLVTNQLEARLPSRAETAECLAHFGPTRWNDFSSDVEWFREHHAPGAWQYLFRDRGFNATPVWSTLGYWLSRWGPASNEQILTLALLDVLAILILWGVVWRTFGWQVACVALIWWGASEGYSYLGGAFLRNDAYVCAVLGICAMRVGRPALAGAALASAVLLRIFPIVLLAGVGLKVVFTAYRAGIGAAWRQYRRFTAGFVLTCVIMLALSALTWAPSWGGIREPWHAFAENTNRHVGTPTPNQLGLRALLSLGSNTTATPVETSPVDDSPQPPNAVKMSILAARQPLYWAFVLAFCAIFAFRAWFLEDWVLLVLAVALLPIVASLANYYYSILLVFAFLWPLDKPIGIGLVALASFVRLLPALTDTRADAYVLASAGLVLFSVLGVARARPAGGTGRRNSADITPVDSG